MTHFLLAADPVDVVLVDYKDRSYGAPYDVRKSHRGPGWFVDGTTLGGEYGGKLRMQVLRNPAPDRRHPHFSCKVEYGYRTKRDALAAIERLFNV